MDRSRILAWGLGLGCGLVLGAGVAPTSASIATANGTATEQGRLGTTHLMPMMSKQGSKQTPLLRCRVVGIRTGQLALRHTPGGASRAGLNNGNIVDVYEQQGIWDYVQVVSGPNRRVTGLWGWVNTNYLACND
ncbi:SH3 domain-containing protein [Limnothrix sp. FACHB-881]|uniref:SH3 domain-containing protein n=1 Tax=Limnothrix sp. FACHB-881 TaxID=2692819 RepID=UPI001683052B|nr:SH3 domain-containing protein [Limnothrix sp. FACHB-881]MBD2637245.1 SH3 domain-containing protein [Limnothrix sp. FACHB-881]